MLQSVTTGEIGFESLYYLNQAIYLACIIKKNTNLLIEYLYSIIVCYFLKLTFKV